MNRLLYIALFSLLTLSGFGQTLRTDTSLFRRSLIYPGQIEQVSLPLGSGLFDPWIITNTGKIRLTYKPEVIRGLPDSLAQTRTALGVRTQFMSLGAIRGFSLPASFAPDAIDLTDKDKAGLFRLDRSDTSTPDNVGTVLVTSSGLRYRRVTNGEPINAEWFGAKGDKDAGSLAMARNAIAIQAAINVAAAGNDPGLEGAGSPSKDRSTIVLLPSGTYFTDRTIDVKGAVILRGEEGVSYGGTLIYCLTPGVHVFNLTADTDGGSNAVVIEKLRIRMAGSATPSAAIYSGNPTGSSFHSFTGNDIWFQLDGAAQSAYIALKADDPLFTRCRFDGTVAPAIILGGNSTGELVTNVKIIGCTWYNNQGGCIKAIRVDGLLATGNTVYSNFVPTGETAIRRTPFFVDAIAGSASCSRIQINTNSFHYVNKVIATKHSGTQVLGNVIEQANSRVIEIGGGLTVRNLDMSHNVISGVWSGTVNVAGVGIVPDAPVFAAGTTVANSDFYNIITDSSGVSTTGYYLPRTGYPCNTINSKVSGFSAPYDVQHSYCNLVQNNHYITSITADLPSGFYTMSASTGMPTDPTGFNIWLVSINRYENGSGTAPRWNEIKVTNLKSKLVYQGGWDEQTGALLAWKQIVSVSGSPATGNVPTYNGSDIVWSTPGSGTATATFTANAPLSYSGGVLSLPLATNVANGYLSSTDWVTFNAKQTALGYTPYNATNPSNYIARTGLSATAPLTYDNATGIIGLPPASGSASGYLSSADWTTFNARLSASMFDSFTASNATNLATKLNTSTFTSFTATVAPHPNSVLSGFVAETVLIDLAETNLTFNSGTAYGYSITPYSGATLSKISYYVSSGGSGLTSNSGSVINNGWVLTDASGNVLAWADGSTDFTSSGVKQTSLNQSVNLTPGVKYILFFVATASVMPQLYGQNTPLLNINVNAMPYRAASKAGTPLNRVSAVSLSGWTASNNRLWGGLTN